jgi:hypothetical protein
MATKSMGVGGKRKGAPAAKGNPGNEAKKPRFDNRRTQLDDDEDEGSDDFEDSSDSEDGGVKLDSHQSDKAFDRKGVQSAKSLAAKQQGRGQFMSWFL